MSTVAEGFTPASMTCTCRLPAVVGRSGCGRRLDVKLISDDERAPVYSPPRRRCGDGDSACSACSAVGQDRFSVVHPPRCPCGVVLTCLSMAAAMVDAIRRMIDGR